MVPIEVIHNPKKGYQVVHRCQTCNHLSRNVIHLDDEVQPDSLEAVLEIMKKPLF